MRWGACARVWAESEREENFRREGGSEAVLDAAAPPSPAAADGGGAGPDPGRGRHVRDEPAGGGLQRPRRRLGPRRRRLHDGRAAGSSICENGGIMPQWSKLHCEFDCPGGANVCNAWGMTGNLCPMLNQPYLRAGWGWHWEAITAGCQLAAID